MKMTDEQKEREAEKQLPFGTAEADDIIMHRYDREIKFADVHRKNATLFWRKGEGFILGVNGETEYINSDQAELIFKILSNLPYTWDFVAIGDTE